MNLSGYAQAIIQLRSASRGSYGAPAVSPAMLQQAYDAIAGVDTEELRSGARLAAGDTETAKVDHWLLPVLKFIGNLGAGLLASEVLDKAQSWFSNRGEAEEVADAAGRAADAIDITLVESDEGTAAILAQLTEIIAQISAHLDTIDFQEHPEAFATVVRAGADIINDASAMILGLCADRDKAIEECYGALIEHGRQICGMPVSPLAPAVAGGVSTAGGGGGGSAAGGGGASTVPAGITDTSGSGEMREKPVVPPLSTIPASLSENTEDLKEEAKKDTSEDVPQEVEKKDCEVAEQEDKAAEKPVETECEQDTEEDNTEEDSAEEPAAETPEKPAEFQTPELLAGILGVGLLIAGVGVIVNFLEQAAQEVLAALTPETGPEVLEPVVEKTAVADLAAVPEPPAKPVPTAAASGAPAAVQVNHVPTVAPPVEAPPAATPAEDTGQPRVHKAGGWV